MQILLVFNRSSMQVFSPLGAVGLSFLLCRCLTVESERGLRSSDFIRRREDDMSEMEMNNDVETEELTDELSDEALDREGRGKWCGPSYVPPNSRPLTDR